MSKRNRSSNWEEEEKMLFRSLIKEYSHDIENKTLSTNTNKMKTKAWEELHKKFNSLNSRPGELSQLKVQWKGMKVNARKVCGAYKMERNKTGGGVRPTTPDETMLEIKDLLNPAELLIDNNEYDSDGIVFIPYEPPADKETNAAVALPEEILLPVQEMVTAEIDSPEEKSEQISATPLKTDTGKIRGEKKLSIQKKCGMKSRKDRQEDYVDRMAAHSGEIKERESKRRMEMAEEKHALEIQILKENLLKAIAERKLSEETLLKLKNSE